MIEGTRLPAGARFALGSMASGRRDLHPPTSNADGAASVPDKAYKRGVALEIHPRVAGLDPALFWQECPGPDLWPTMIAKYEELAAIAGLADGERDASYRERLAALAQRWPGALREGELIGPERVAERLAAARADLAPSDGRAQATVPAKAVLCWAEIHGQIGDLMRFRRASRSRETLDFDAWLDAPEHTAARRRWPAGDLLALALGPHVKVRSAYLALAARAGLALPQLNELLFARTGHWDRRADDPSWAHA